MCGRRVQLLGSREERKKPSGSDDDGSFRLAGWTVSWRPIYRRRGVVGGISVPVLAGSLDPWRGWIWIRPDLHSLHGWANGSSRRRARNTARLPLWCLRCELASLRPRLPSTA
jgi:hypothetical protein